MQKVIVRSAYAYDADMLSEETGLACEDESKTQQHQKEDADINVIVRRFGLTGELPQNVRMPQYGDFTGITDYQSALNAVKAAESAFMQMPAAIRNRFQNDPQQFVEFCFDDANREEAIKLGLVPEKKSEPVKEQAPPVTPPVASAGTAQG